MTDQGQSLHEFQSEIDQPNLIERAGISIACVFMGVAILLFAMYGTSDALRVAGVPLPLFFVALAVATGVLTVVSGALYRRRQLYLFSKRETGNYVPEKDYSI